MHALDLLLGALIFGVLAMTAVAAFRKTNLDALGMPPTNRIIRTPLPLDDAFQRVRSFAASRNLTTVEVDEAGHRLLLGVSVGLSHYGWWFAVHLLPQDDGSSVHVGIRSKMWQGGRARDKTLARVIDGLERDLAA